MNTPTIKTELPNASPVTNRRVAFVGKLGGVNRKEARRVVRRLGGTMVERMDPTVDLIVIGADAPAFTQPDELQEDWIRDAIDQQRITVHTETQFWQMVGVVEPEMDVSQFYTPAMLADLLAVPISAIRRWHRRGLITPTRQVKKLPYFDFQEVASARRIAAMVASSANPTSIEKQLSKLAQQFPNLQRPLSQLSLSVDGKDVLLRREVGLAEPNGQRRFDFGQNDPRLGGANAGVGDSDGHASGTTAPDAPATISIAEAKQDWNQSPDANTPPITSKYEFLRMALELEDAGETRSAIEVYRAMSLAHGPTADVSFRIAELLYQVNDLQGARERYFMAVEFDETFVEARANLGCVLVELEQFDLAISSFEGALDHHSDYPDVHFHLARLLDELGRREQAETHWQKFLALTPSGPWAEEARQRIGDQSN